MPLPDRELVEACLRGEPRAWEEFVQTLTPWVKGVVRKNLARRGPNPQDHDVDDLASATFQQLLGRDKATLKAFGPPYLLKPWIAVIASRVCSHAARDANPPTQSLDKAPPPAVLDLPPDESAQMLERLLASLSPEDRALLELFYVQQRSYDDIALLLAIPSNSIGKRKFRIMKRLEALPEYKKIQDLLR